MINQPSQPPKRVLSLFSLVMINVIAVDSLRSLPFGAEYGLAVIFFYALAGLCFFVPIALVSAELATAWPKTGGLYVWVREAFGVRWGFLAIWLQWIYNVVWYPTILSFLAATVIYLINPALLTHKLFMLVIILILFWTATFVNCLGMRASSMLSTLGAIVGTLLPMFFIILLGLLWLWEGKPTQIQFTWGQAIPNLTHWGNLSFLSVVVFGLIGLEMSASHAEEVKNPERNFPRALLISALLIWCTLVLASLAIAIVIPPKQIDLVAGLIAAFEVFFKAYHMTWMGPVIATLIVIGGFSGVGAWLIGPTKGLLAAAHDGSIPPFFQRTNRKGVPTRLLLAQGIIFTLMCTIFFLMPSVNSSYWVLSAMTAQLALLTYLLFFAAAIRLRYKFPKAPNTYRIPGGKLGIWCIGLLGVFTCLGATLLGFIPPSQIKTGSLVTYECVLVGGIIIFCGLPFLIRVFAATSKE